MKLLRVAMASAETHNRIYQNARENDDPEEEQIRGRKKRKPHSRSLVFAREKKTRKNNINKNFLTLPDTRGPVPAHGRDVLGDAPGAVLLVAGVVLEEAWFLGGSFFFWGGGVGIEKKVRFFRSRSRLQLLLLLPLLPFFSPLLPFPPFRPTGALVPGSPALIAGQVSRVQYWWPRTDCKSAAASKEIDEKKSSPKLKKN